MIKLIKLLTEIENKSKMIVMAGAAGSGKTHLAKEKLKLDNLPGFTYFNPDNYVEDKKHEFHNNLRRASIQIDNKDVPQAMEKNQNFIWDTTASNANKMLGGTYRRKEVEGILNNDEYDTLMVMVYAHPIISFLKNFKRERKVPKVGVLSTWNSVYGNINRYKSALGDNFILYQAPHEEILEKDPDIKQQVKEYDKAAQAGELEEYFYNLVSQDPGKYASTFRKDDSNLSPDELAKKEKQREKTRELFDKQVKHLEDQFGTIQNQIDELGAEEGEVISKIKSFV